MYELVYMMNGKTFPLDADDDGEALDAALAMTGLRVSFEHDADGRFWTRAAPKALGRDPASRDGELTDGARCLRHQWLKLQARLEQPAKCEAVRRVAHCLVQKAG